MTASPGRAVSTSRAHFAIVAGPSYCMDTSTLAVRELTFFPVPLSLRGWEASCVMRAATDSGNPPFSAAPNGLKKAQPLDSKRGTKSPSRIKYSPLSCPLATSGSRSVAASSQDR